MPPYVYLPWVRATWKDYMCSRLVGSCIDCTCDPLSFQKPSGFLKLETSYTALNRNCSWINYICPVTALFARSPILSLDYPFLLPLPLSPPLPDVSSPAGPVLFFFLGLKLLATSFMVQCPVLVFLYRWFQRYLHDDAWVPRSIIDHMEFYVGVRQSLFILILE